MQDPRNIKYLWFYDDSTKEYYKINAADQSMPDIPLWEYKLIKKSLKDNGIEKPSTFHLIEARDELNKQIEDSIKKTKKARRIKQRNKNKNIELKLNKNNKNDDDLIESNYNSKSNNIWDEDIPDFG